jgi:hypothetical protein
MIRLLNFLVSLRRLPPLCELSGDEERMLFELRAHWEQTGSLNFGDAYGLIPLQSPATTYRQIIALKDKGFLDITVVEQDRRKRLIRFTTLADNLFGHFG